MSDDKHEVVIVGASAAGLRCAARLARLRPRWPVTVVEACETFSFAACGMPYVLSGDIADLETLRRTADGALRDVDYFARVKGVEILAGRRAVAIEAGARALIVEDGAGRTRRLSWDDLVLATGARARRLPGQPDHPRVMSFHTAADVEPLRQGLAGGRIGHAVVIGAGFLGCELSEAFSALWGAEVTLLEAADTPLPALLDPEAAAIVAQTLRGNGVDLRLGMRVDRLEPDDDRVCVHLAGQDPVCGDVAVVAIGVAPETDLAVAAGISLGPTGAIAVDDRQATSIPHVWAIGDAAESRHAVTGRPAYVPLGSLANRQGRTLANILAGGDDRFPAVTGASALKVFDLNVAATGITRRAAEAAGEDVRSIWISAHDRADYWPEAAEIAVQLTWDAPSRRVIGVQIVGEGDAAKRADVATQLLHRHAGLADFAQLEHAYSPPYAPALDPLAVAAMVAENAAPGPACRSPLEDLAGCRILDVRHPDEVEARPLPLSDVTHLPQADLREVRDETALDPDLVVCERGTRSAEVVRWLAERGTHADYLGGGLRWRALAGLDSKPDTAAGSP